MVAGSTDGVVLESELRTPGDLALLVVGTDTLIEALPARPIQLANACGDLGFDLVLPLSWGDELVAEAVLQSLEFRGPVPALLCACPLVRQRLLAVGRELADSMVSLVAPPVALARQLRATMGDRIRSLSFVGHCPGAAPPDYDISYEPEELFALFRDRGIVVESQPDFFVDRVPADRSRFVSLPGGCPSPDILWKRCNERALIELESGVDLSVEIAQHLVSPHSVLVDAGPAVGCACAGVTPSTAGISARIAVTSLEPPRSATPVFTNSAKVALEQELPITQPASTALIGRPPMAVTPPGALSTIVRRR
jgi:hypothetical protein